MNNIFKFLLMIILPSIVMSFENHQLSLQLIKLMKSRPEINSYLEESIQKAKKTNPDKKYNPVQSLDAFLKYADDFAHTLPGQLPPGNMYHSKGTVTRESIHQNIMYFYFLLNQPLKGLENKGLFKNTLQYYPPFNQWLIALTKEKGKFLMSPSSWSEENLISIVNPHLLILTKDGIVKKIFGIIIMSFFHVMWCQGQDLFMV